MNKVNNKEYPFNLLSNYFLDSNEIGNYSIFEIDAHELILPERLDLIAKLMYIEYREKKIKSEFAKDVYIDNIKAFSNGTFTEPGDKDKNSIEKYLFYFNKMIDEIKKSGFDDSISLVPIGKNNELLDGAHRVSCCAYFGKKVKVIKFDNLERNYGYEFFKYRGMRKDYLDYLIIKYCEIKNNQYVACIWPSACGNDKISKANNYIYKKTEVLCKKEIKLNFNGLKNLMIQIYGHQEWVGDFSNNYKYVNSKVSSCFADNNIILYIFKMDCLDKVIELKKEIRNIFDIGNHSIHITDNKGESMQIVNLLFNDNSIEHLNKSIPYKYKDFNILLKRFKEKIIHNNLDLNNFVIDSSSVLAVYGLRPSYDIDYLSLVQNSSIIDEELIQSHDSELKHYNLDKDEIILSPLNYFVYQNVKFTTLDLLLRLKKNRGEKKDKDDCRLIEMFIANRKNKFIENVCRELKIRIRRQKSACKSNVILILKKLNLYSSIKKIFNGINKIK